MKDHREFKMLFSKAQRLCYSALEEIAVLHNKPEDALELSEKSRGRTYVEHVSSKLTDSVIGLRESLKPEALSQVSVKKMKEIAQKFHCTFVEYSMSFR